MPTGLNFNPEYIGNDIWFAGVGEDSGEEEEINNINQNQNNDQNIEQEMDTNDLHEIIHDPHSFHIPNTNHKPSIRTQELENTIETQIDNSNNFFPNESIDDDQYHINNLFENIEEEIIFNNEEIDEDELDQDSEDENELILNQPEQLNNGNKRMRKPNSK